MERRIACQRWLAVPSVCGANLEHGVEDGGPSVWGFQHRVGEHATVPADMLDAALMGVFEPVAGAADDIEFAVGVIGWAVFSGFVVGAAALDLSIVLSDVEIDGPWSELVGHLGVGFPELVLGVAFVEEGVFWGVVAEEVEVSVSQIGLEAEGFGHGDFFEEVEHIAPAMHTGPADFSFGGETFTVIGSDLGGEFEGFGDAGGVGLFVGTPFFDAMFGGIDADDAVLADAVFIEDTSDAASDSDGIEEAFAGGVITHRRIANGPRPHRGDERADGEAVGGDEFGDLVEFLIGAVGIGVGEEEEVVDPIELLPVDVRSCGKFEHAL